MGLSEQEGQEPKAQGEEVPQVGVGANQEGCRASCGVLTGGQADVVSTGQLLLLAALLNDTYGKQVFC